MSSEVCSICLEHESKYTCPACESKTCSLECVKRHKLRTECTGVVDPTKFIPNNDLGSRPALVNRDYNYLLNFERRIKLGKSDIKDNAKQIFKRTLHQPKNNKRSRLDGSLDEDSRLALVREAFPNMTTTSVKRDNTLVINLPTGMSRSSQNKSGYDKKSSAFTWTVEWVPLSNGGIPMKSFISFRLKESTTLKELVPATILAKYFDMDSMETEGLTFYLENCVSASRTLSLIPLNGTDTLASALKDKIVLEFPKVYVSLTPVLGADLSASDGYGINKPVSPDSATSDSDSELDSDSDSDSESDTDSSGTDSSSDDSDSDSDDAPEEESSRKPEMTEQEKSTEVE